MSITCNQEQTSLGPILTVNFDQRKMLISSDEMTLNCIEEAIDNQDTRRLFNLLVTGDCPNDGHVTNRRTAPVASLRVPTTTELLRS